MRAYRGRRVEAPFILNLLVKLTLRPIYHQERTAVSIDERNDWVPEPFGTFGDAKNHLLHPGCHIMVGECNY
jgi:hypothetical protein